MEKDPVAPRPESFTSKKPIDFPCTHVRLVPAQKVVANDYNPNRVATPELDLLEHSIREDGVTQPIVVHYDDKAGRFVVIDGFHRYAVMTKRLEMEEIPVVPITRDAAQRKAATIRHNQARGQHQTELLGVLLEALMQQGWDDDEIADHLGMEEEELLRLKQVRGIANC